MKKANYRGMKSGRMIRRVAVMLLCAALLLMSVSALAIDPFKPSEKVSLTLKWKAGEEIPEGAHFKIYRVASADRFAVFTPVAPFDTYPVEMNKLDNAGWVELANTLSGYADADGLEPTEEGDLDGSGSLKFGGLKTGLYLVTGSVFVGYEKIFTPEPFMISLPDRDEEEKWLFDVTAQVKYTSTDRDLTSRKVIKVWSDSGAEQYRPSQVTVQLLRDDTVCEDVKLSRDNNWRHEWTHLDAAYRWQVVEKDVPSGYKVKTSLSDTTVTITNSRSSSGGSSSGTIAQTGQLWWPVPVLAGLGILFFLIGFIKNRGARHE